MIRREVLWKITLKLQLCCSAVTTVGLLLEIENFWLQNLDNSVLNLEHNGLNFQHNGLKSWA